MFRQRDFGSPDQLHSWESSTPEAMDSDNEYTVVMGRRMKKRMRQMSSEQTSSNERDQQSFMVSYVPLTASHNLNSLIFGLPLVWCNIVIGLSAAVYTALGGLRGVVWTDCVQLLFILLGPATIIAKVLIDWRSPATSVQPLEEFDTRSYIWK
ncbi:hypothetical protein HPB49_006524 [Dermacentor silvarum]|uniref:Uncharacterized protein n=1 Tax=Dermacentor silvarum TaxID=543639 RepID=A0ACB8C7T2_DERSI|nr:hypothetical protein HPB49_006524 [Dermacentor silvarum]